MHKLFVFALFSTLFILFNFVFFFFHMSLWEHNAKNAVKKPLTAHALQIFLIKATAYCFRERKIK